MSIREEFLITRQGKQHVLYAGLLEEAHSRGLRSIETHLLKYDMDGGEPLYAIAKAVVEMEDGRRFEGIGDATRKNVSKNISPHLIRMAETRAKARALRDAVNIGATALEELGEAEAEPYPSVQKTVSESEPAVEVEREVTHDTDAEYKLVQTELWRIYYRIPEEKRPEEETVLRVAEGGLARAREGLKRLRFLAAGAGRLPEEPESEDEIDAQIVREYIEESVASEAGLHDEQEEVIEELAEKLYGQESKVLSGLEWFEEQVLGHPISDLSRSEGKQWIDAMRGDLRAKAFG